MMENTARQRDRLELDQLVTRSETEDAEQAAGPRPKSVADGGTPVEGSVLSAEELEQLTADIVAAIKTVYDPEIPADIYELGLIYKIDVDDERNVAVLMTLTAPGCPVAGEMPIWVENAVGSVPGVGRVDVELTFDPPWDMSRMSDEARLALNMF
jgi:FeS assembly SUF system protein